MPRKPNEPFGQCKCRHCGGVAEVRRLKNHEAGDRYLYCQQCGTDRPAFRDAVGQAAIDKWIDANQITEQQGEQQAEPQEPAQQQSTAPVTEQRTEQPPPVQDKGARWIDSVL